MVLERGTSYKHDSLLNISRLGDGAVGLWKWRAQEAEVGRQVARERFHSKTSEAKRGAQLEYISNFTVWRDGQICVGLDGNWGCPPRVVRLVSWHALGPELNPFTDARTT